MIKIFVDKFFYIIKRFIFSILVIYTFNMIVFPIGVVIPMNFFTIIAIMLFGFPAVIGFSMLILFVI